MAGRARELPKWQASKSCAKRTTKFCDSKYCTTQENIFKRFFYLQFKILSVKYRYKKQKRNPNRERYQMIATTIQPVVGMYFSAIRNRDDKSFVGQIAAVKHMGSKGTMIVVKIEDSTAYASVYLDECFDYAWSDFALPALQGR